MEGAFETCIFRWSLHNPFLPSETKEAIFCFRSPKVTQWKAFLQRGQGRRAVNNWPVSFSLQYFPPDEADDEVLEVDVSVNFVEIGNILPSPEHVVFKSESKYTYTYNSSIRPEHSELEIIVKILIPRRHKEVIELAPNDLKSLSNDLKRLRSEPRYINMWLQSKDPDTRFPVHSYILDARWSHFYSVLDVQPDPADPPTVETDILPDVLDDILTYLYTGSLEHLHLRDPRFEEYRTELFQTIDKYPLHHLYMMFDPNPKFQFRDTITHLSSSAMVFRLEEARVLGPYVWTHSPLPGVSVTTSLKFTLVKDEIPSLCYTLRFTNAAKLSARVNLEYRRKVVGWDSEMRRILYECDHEIPCNRTAEVSIPITPTLGNPSNLLSFIEGGDRREGRHAVEHSFRFILYLSTGEKCIKSSEFYNFPYDEEQYQSFVKEKKCESSYQELSFNILSKHMSNVRRWEVGTDLKVLFQLGISFGTKLYPLHRAIFAARVPNWRNVIEVVPRDDDIPCVFYCTVSCDAFPYIVDFLYTGTCSSIPKHLLSEITSFARRGGILSLEKGAPCYVEQIVNPPWWVEEIVNPKRRRMQNEYHADFE